MWDEDEDGLSSLNIPEDCDISNTTHNSVLEISALCCDEDLIGYDRNTGGTWIYPTNYPVRDYQYNIVQSALFKNTLVSLPTGLGKTFIAAVIMYNFYRWYPMGKIIFVAPTRPLVSQQIDACYNIMAIPPDDTIEMTGTTKNTIRKTAWQNKRVFFATPQVIQNDLESGICPGELVRCLVIDEAHKARGKHSYCQIIELLILKKYRLFRVLALSATPGSKVEDVIKVVQNLKISHLELRSEECLDVAMYSHSRKIQTIVISLGIELSNIMKQFIEILDVYTRRLVQYRILSGNIGGLSKGRIIMLFKEYQTREKSLRHPQHKFIMLDFTMIITLYHALELLTKHGARVFLNFFDEHPDKTWVGKDDQLTCFLERLRDDLGVNPLHLDTSTLPDGNIPEIEEEINFGHPKFDRLKKIILEHFELAKSKNQDTKAIVFCEYRESVKLVNCLFLKCRPLIKPLIFIGQGVGSNSVNGQTIKPFSQKQQLHVMKLFREGICNVLVSTCIGEEGLDVGNVDLIVCFDISNKSPVRLVQRCGRTGRERNGKVIILVTEGREHQTLQDCMYQRDNLNKRILQSKELKKHLYTANPRLLPQNVTPQCQKMFITVKKQTNDEDNKKSKHVQTKINMFTRNVQNNEEENIGPFLTKTEFLDTYGDQIPQIENKYNNLDLLCFKKDIKNIININSCIVSDWKPSRDEYGNLSKWLEWQRNLQYTCKIQHSLDSKMLSEILHFADSKRFNLTSPSKITESSTSLQSTINCKVETLRNNKNKSNKNLVKTNNNDIRKLFKKLNRFNNKEQYLYDEKYDEILSKCGIDNTQKSIDNYLKDYNISSTLVNFMVEMNINESDSVKVNKTNFDICNELNKLTIGNEKLIINKIQIPKVSTIEYLCPEVLDNFLNRDKNVVKYSHINMKKDNFNINENEISLIKENSKILDKSTNLENIDFETIFEDSYSADSKSSQENINTFDHSLNMNAKMGPKTEQKSLGFFGLNSIDDIFADDSYDEIFAELPVNENKSNTDIESLDEESHSPILYSQIKTNQNLSKLNVEIFSNKMEESPVNNNQKNLTNLAVNKTMKNNETGVSTDNNSTLFSVTQIMDMINEKQNSNLDVKKIYSQANIYPMSENNITDIKKIDDSDSSSNSIILCSQQPKWNNKNANKNNIKKNIVIPATSESSIDDSETDDFKTKYNTNRNDNDISLIENSFKNDSKRKLSSDEECSPYFTKIPKMDSPTLLKNQKRYHKNILKSKSVNRDSKLSHYKPLMDNPEQRISNSNNKNCKENILSQLEVFEISNKKQLGGITSTNKAEKSYISEDSNDFVSPLIDKKNSVKSKIKTSHNKKNKNKKCCFIDYEAILSDDSYSESSDDECEDESVDTSMERFVCDEHTEVNESIDMEAKYLQSVKSPVKTYGKFKIPNIPKENTDMISQYTSNDQFYELDSFCVDIDQGLTQRQDMSELELAEAVLKKRKRRKRIKIRTKSKKTSDFLNTQPQIIENKNLFKKKNLMRIQSDSESNDNSN